MPITVPPLRERKEDIPGLIDFFLQRFSLETKKNFTEVAPDAQEKLLAYDWPGNVRELANVMERALVTGTEPRSRATDLAGSPRSTSFFEEVVHQERHVLRGVPERRKLDRDDVEPIKKVLAESMLGDGLGEVAIGRRDHATFGRDRLGPAHAFEPLVLKHPEQLGLHAERDLADLVEQQGAPAGLLEAPLPLAVGAGEGLARWPEELAFQQVFRGARRS